jgi:hypothetical protein
MKRPSIDRIDRKKNYELKNCRYIEFKLNASRDARARTRDFWKLHSDRSKYRSRKTWRKYYDLEWLREQVKTRTNRDIARECRANEAVVGRFIDRYINYSECKNWTEYEQKKRNFKNLKEGV